MFISHARKKVLLSIFIATFLATPTISYGVDDANNPAIISGTNSGSVTEDINPDDDGMLKVSGVLTITDPDPGEAVFKAASSTGDYGSLIINSAGNWRYAASNNQSIIQNLSSTSYLVEFFAIHSADNTTRYVIITINGADETNSPAIISGTYFGIMTEDINPDDDGMLKVSGALTITDPDPGEAVFKAASITGEYGSLIINSAGNWSYAASNSQSVIQNLSSTTYLLDFFTIRSADNTTHSVIIGIKGADETNTADAITLSWNAPSEREDNTAIALSEIAGFKIYAGTTQGQYLGSITINDGSATNYTFEGVTTGTYYFAMTTLDTDGRESQHSAEIQINH